MQYRPWAHPCIDRPAASRTHPIEREVLRLVRHDADLATDNLHQPDKFPRIAMAVFHADNVWTLNQPWEYGDRNFHFMVDRIVIDQKTQLGKHLRDLSVKVSHIFGRLL